METIRDRRREATRQRIMSAAVDIAADEGWPGVTMRKVADRVDYTHAALYGYFATKDDLLGAMLHEGLAQFSAALTEAARTAADDEAAVLALASVLWTFPWAHPELYQVMHGLGGVAFGSSDLRAEGRAAVTPALPVVARVLARAGGDPAEAEQRCILLWCTIHGLVTLTMAGRFDRAEGATLSAAAARDTLAALQSSRGHPR